MPTSKGIQMYVMNILKQIVWKSYSALSAPLREIDSVLFRMDVLNWKDHVYAYCSVELVNVVTPRLEGEDRNNIIRLLKAA